ncbi:uncharacterized protein EDB91DRAFT_1088337 [Suillus paluster]|uniref:uncharacterized protein n=1 Tax=Suillus paluster TaxID=48578 RepID=UPI001B86FC0D|nr:uncharacterized protein EDB91DRAFT_1088337 [Suillus paluster]KAG1721821.1 hypothetical protein EDB91DRAFT_1088337 [Suillus paluster]
MRHSWHSKALAWQALGDHSFNLAHEVDGSATDNAPSPSTSVDGDALEKGKGKAREVELEPEKKKEMEKPKEEQEKPHRKQPFSRMSKPLPKSAMKTPKRGKLGQERKLRESVDSSDEEEEEDRLSKPRSNTSSVIVTRRVSATQPSRPSGPPRSLGSLKKAAFGPGMTPLLMHPDVPELSQVTSESPRDVPPVVDARAILIPRLDPCRHHMRVVYRVDKGLIDRLVDLPVKGVDPKSIPGAPRSQGQSKPTGSVTMPVPPAAIIASSSSAAPHAAQDLPILDLHWMSIASQLWRLVPLNRRAQSIRSEGCMRAFDIRSCTDIRHSPSRSLLPPNPPVYSWIKPLPGEEGSTIVALVMKPTNPPSQTEAALDPATAIALTVPVDAVHSPADDGASTFTSAFALPAPPAMNPTPLETPEDGLSAEYDSGDEQDDVMEIVLSNQYSIPTIVQTSEPRTCSKESQGPSPKHIGAQYSVFAFRLLILGPPTLIPDVRWHLVLGAQYLVRLSVHVLGTRYSVPVLSPQLLLLGPRYSILSAWATIPNPRYSVLNSQYSPPGLQFAILDPRYSVLRSQYFVLQYLILAARVAIPDPRYSVLGTRCSVCHTRYSFI